MELRYSAGGIIAIAFLFLGTALANAQSFTISGLKAHQLHPGQDYYPATDIRLGVTGQIVLGYSVGLDGVPGNFSVLVPGDAALESASAKLLSNLRFEVPETWQADGGPWRRLHIQINWIFSGDPQPPKLIENDDVITVAAVRLKRRG